MHQHDGAMFDSVEIKPELRSALMVKEAAYQQQLKASADAQDRHEFQPHLQEEADAKNENQHERPPHDAIDGPYD